VDTELVAGTSLGEVIEPVIKRLTDAAALTASLSLYRAILTPESLVEEGMTGSARYLTGAVRARRRGRPLAATRRTRQGQCPAARIPRSAG
jgi:hypothetical protein